MNLHSKLKHLAAQGKPLRVGMIGAGKFGSMYLSQVPRTPGIHMVGIADLSPTRARNSLRNVGWHEEAYGAESLEQAAKQGNTAIIDDGMKLIESPFVDIIIDATGNPAVGIAHVLACCQYQKHIVMVNVEADALAGPLLKQRADEAGIVYSLAYGDQPALIFEMVDW
ncbi:Gfo/Idh/MocA family oxidoreductase, partial [Limnobacter sp.]|uniref:Gfo/Idh/MocA family oxidoreductase n=1 Tax=Limnobacter sp. TaxID=2003368 RepID=UPI0035173100